MNADERLEELVVAYVRGEADAAQLQELKGLLEGDDDRARRAAELLAQANMVAGWFHAETDDRFVAEAGAAVETKKDDPEFLRRTLERVRKEPARRRPGTRRFRGASNAPAFLVALTAASLLFGILVLLTLSDPPPPSREPDPAAAVRNPPDPPPPPVVEAPPPAPPTPEPVAPSTPAAPKPEPAPPRPAPPPAPKPAPAPHPPPASPAETTAAVARIERAVGAVTRRAPDLLPGEGLKTGPASSAVVVYADGTRLEVGEATTVEEFGERPKRLKLTSGTIVATVARQPADQPMVLRTPHAEVHVLGTRLRLTASDVTRVEVKEGKVRLIRLSDRKAVDVAGGHASGLDLVARPTLGPAFTIREIPAPGLALWLRADVGVSLEGGAVSTWEDHSGYARHAAQSLPECRPRLVPVALGGRPVLRFDGADDHLSTAVPVEGLKGLTIFLVCSNTADRTGGANHGSNAALFWEESAQWGWIYLSPFRSNVKFRFGTTQSDNLPFFIRPEPIDSAFTITTAMKDGVRDSLWVQGALVVRDAGKLPSLKGAPGPLMVGAGTGKSGFPGDIAEILIYSRALADPERVRVERALLQKYFPGKK